MSSHWMVPWGRNEKELTELVQRLKAAYPDIVLMADLATAEEGIICEKQDLTSFYIKRLYKRYDA